MVLSTGRMLSTRLLTAPSKARQLCQGAGMIDPERRFLEEYKLSYEGIPRTAYGEALADDASTLH